jgi:hypothetical protein
VSIELTEQERAEIAAACDAAIDFGSAWVRFLRNGDEQMLLPVVERIVAARIASAVVEWSSRANEGLSVAVLAAKAEAWDEGFASDYEGDGWPPNPYREATP